MIPADWDAYFMSFADLAATKSKDSTKVGAALVDPDGTVRLTAYNGPPKGVRDTPDRFERPAKYLYASHAEANLIAFAARKGASTLGATVYCTHPPCASCARTMIQAGIGMVVHRKGVLVGEQYAEETRAAAQMFAEAGVKREVL